MRNEFLKGLYELAKKDDRVTAVLADNGLIVFDDFRRDFPDRSINFGIAENNMVAQAAGMASCGLIPYCYTISNFLAYRSYEFIRNDVCLQNQNVKIVGIGPGLTYSIHGPSHHTTEDISMLRSIPGLTIFSPATRTEARWSVYESYNIEGPVYIRLGNNNKDYYSDSNIIKKGIPSCLKDGDEIVFFATGPILNVAMECAEEIEKENGKKIGVYSFHTLKPIDRDAVAETAKKYSLIITIEEHNVIGGLYSIVSEILFEKKVYTTVKAIGLNDEFAKGYGSIDELRSQNGLDKETLKNIING